MRWLGRWMWRCWDLRWNKKLDYLFLHVTGWKARMVIHSLEQKMKLRGNICFKQRKVLFYEWNRNKKQGFGILFLFFFQTWLLCVSFSSLFTPSLSFRNLFLGTACEKFFAKQLVQLEDTESSEVLLFRVFVTS